MAGALSLWMAQVKQWWAKGQGHCHYLVSDGARALVKLAVSELGWVNVPDLFHALRALGRPMGRAFSTQFAALKKQQEKLQKQLSKCGDVSAQPALQSSLEQNACAQQQLQQAPQTYPDALAQLSQIIHPFTLDSQQWQTERALLTHLAPPLQHLWNLAPTYGTQKAQKAIDTFEGQIAAFVSILCEVSTHLLGCRRPQWLLGKATPGQTRVF